MSDDSPQPNQPRCRVVRPGDAYTGKQGPTYVAGVSAESVGSTALWLGTITVAPGARTNAHVHERHETAIHVMSGEVEMWSGPELGTHHVVAAGDYIYIPPGVAHVAANRSRTVAATAIVARTDPNEQESVVLLPELDPLAALTPAADEHGQG